jgi:hypothetical protein
MPEDDDIVDDITPCPKCGQNIGEHLIWLTELELVECLTCKHIFQPYTTVIWIEKIVMMGEECFLARQAHSRQVIKCSANPHLVDYYLKQEYPWREIRVRY